MTVDSGRNAQNLKQENRCLVLKTIATNPPISRGELAEATNLSKMTMSNIIAELIQTGMVSEQSAGRSASVGRRPVSLDLAEDSPCLCGVFIGRSHCVLSLADLRARIFSTRRIAYPAALDAPRLLRLISAEYRALAAGCTRRILGIGIAAMGPVSTEDGMILRPSNFFGLHDVPIVAALREASDLPCFLMPDSLAGALAERLYGKGRAIDDFLFLLLWDGIGCGIIVDGKPYGGRLGMSGEIGHMSIRTNGALCPCGRRGCLELYASESSMQHAIRAEIAAGTRTLLAADSRWADILHAANAGDDVALATVGAYCDHVAEALINYVNLCDPQTIFLCHQGLAEDGDVLVRLLRARVQGRYLAAEHRKIGIETATFAEKAVVIGSVAICAARVFDGSIGFGG